MTSDIRECCATKNAAEVLASIVAVRARVRTEDSVIIKAEIAIARMATQARIARPSAARISSEKTVRIRASARMERSAIT